MLGCVAHLTCFRVSQIWLGFVMILATIVKRRALSSARGSLSSMDAHEDNADAKQDFAAVEVQEALTLQGG